MILTHTFDLLSHPNEAWVNLRNSQPSVANCFFQHLLWVALIPPLCLYLGTTQVGWRVGSGDTVSLTTASALTMAGLFYLAILAGTLALGHLIHWMAETYGAESSRGAAVALATYSITPLMLCGVLGLYPVAWVSLLVGIGAVAHSVYLLFVGVTPMMNINREQGVLFASAILAVALVFTVALMAASVILWNLGAGPVFQ